jgi:hypothetical protein
MQSASLNTKEETRTDTQYKGKRQSDNKNNNNLSLIHKTVIIQIRTSIIQQKSHQFFHIFHFQAV